MERQVESAIAALIPTVQHQATREAVLDDPAEFTFVVGGLRSVHRPASGARPILELQWHLAHGGRGYVRRKLAEFDRLRENDPPGTVEINTLFLEAALLQQLGDSAAASRRLDIALDALPVSRLDLLDDIRKAAGAVRAMALRAELAESSGQRDVARKWAQAVQELWAEAEPASKPLLGRMQAILQVAGRARS
jgi:hypothetical protein